MAGRSQDPPPHLRRWPWIAALAMVVPVVVGSALLPGDQRFWGLVLIPAIASEALVGALLLVRLPGNPIGALLLGSGILLGLSLAASGYALAGASAASGPWRGAAAAGVLGPIIFIVGVASAALGVPLVFPDGRLVSHRWRSVVWLTVLGLAGTAITYVLSPYATDVGGMKNPFAVSELTPWIGVLRNLTVAGIVVGFFSAVLSIGIRFRRGNRLARQQLKWFVAVVSLQAITGSLSTVFEFGKSGILTGLGILTLGAIPVAIGIAVLRYRLYAIDRIISRTISWAIVTGVLVAAFAVLVVALQTLLLPLTGGDSLAVAASTLAVAGLFGPVRTRVQRSVDLRFHRSRYNAERLVETLSGELRAEVGLGAIEHGVRAVTEQALAPEHAGLWLRGVGGREIDGPPARGIRARRLAEGA